jgi:hypothetical protein
MTFYHRQLNRVNECKRMPIKNNLMDSLENRLQGIHASLLLCPTIQTKIL